MLRIHFVPSLTSAGAYEHTSLDMASRKPGSMLAKGRAVELVVGTRMSCPCTKVSIKTS